MASEYRIENLDNAIVVIRTSGIFKKERLLNYYAYNNGPARFWFWDSLKCLCFSKHQIPSLNDAKNAIDTCKKLKL